MEKYIPCKWEAKESWLAQGLPALITAVALAYPLFGIQYTVEQLQLAPQLLRQQQ